MSGSEAAAVLGVISAVISIVDATKKVYDAATDAHGLPKAFKEVSVRLPIITTILQSAHEQIKTGVVNEASCNAMKPIINTCEVRAKKLQDIFEKVIPQDNAHWGERYFKAVRTLGKGGRVEDLMKGILADTQLLSDNYGMTLTNIDGLKQAIEEMSGVEASLPDAIFEDSAFTNYNTGNGPMTNNQVQGNQFTQINTSTGKSFQGNEQSFHFERDQIESQTFRAHTQTFISWGGDSWNDLHNACEDDVLSALAFSGMYEKYEAISDAHENTFQWIYDNPKLKFQEWLQGGSGVYWIKGKAGCGKSTLMKFLHKNPRTLESLPKDIPNILKHLKLIPLVLPDLWEKAVKVRSHSTRDRYSRLPDLSIKDFKDAFKALVDQKSIPLHICLLIDGLDEFSGRHKDIIEALGNLLAKSTDSIVRVQLCLSSRPLIVFENAYSPFWHIRMQDLTAGDITAYVTAEFNKDDTLQRLAASDPVTAREMKDTIIEKAEGVFLWVILVVRSLVEGLDNKDDMKILQRRLSSIPAGLEPLYERIIQNIDTIYHEQAAVLFRMVECAAQPLSPLAMYFADDQPEDALLADDSVSQQQVNSFIDVVSTRLKARSAGLIETRSAVSLQGFGGTSQDQNDAKNPMKVHYLHLTVKEFMQSDKVPVWLSTKIAALGFEFHVRIMACSLRELRISESLASQATKQMPRELHGYDPWPDSFDYITDSVVMILHHAYQAEATMDRSLLIYMESLDCLMMASRLRHSHDQNDLHWTLLRYTDWFEPESWRSDYLAYLVTVGLTQSVLEKFRQGYRPHTKPGRPLLLYATVVLQPDYAITDLERDKVDPDLVKELLRLKCNPNQRFDSERAHDVRDRGERTVWEAVLVYLCMRFGRTDEKRRYYHHQKLLSEKLVVKWLKTIEHFINYGANPNAWVDVVDESALLVVKRVFADYSELCAPVLELMIAKGATEFTNGMGHQHTFSIKGVISSKITRRVKKFVGRARASNS